MKRINYAVKGPSDLYNQMLEIAYGNRGCSAISKAQAKSIGMAWSFVESSAKILNLKLEKCGSHGFIISK